MLAIEHAEQSAIGRLLLSPNAKGGINRAAASLNSPGFVPGALLAKSSKGKGHKMIPPLALSAFGLALWAAGPALMYWWNYGVLHGEDEE